MEYFDIVDEEGKPTGEIVSRDRAHEESVLHRTAHVWIIREKENGVDVLLQKRSMNKDSFPGRYDTSSAGHIPAGDEPEESALRELSEELGLNISTEQLHFAGKFRIQYEEEFHGKPFRDNEVTWVYVYKDPLDISTLTLQESEVESVAWFDEEEVWNEITRDDWHRFCMPIQGMQVLRKYLGK